MSQCIIKYSEEVNIIWAKTPDGDASDRQVKIRFLFFEKRFFPGTLFPVYSFGVFLFSRKLIRSIRAC